MKSLAVRLTLVALFVIATGASAYLFWMGESRARGEAQAARTFDLQAMAATRTLLDLRAAQQAYVAAGQGDQFWADKVTATLGAHQELAGGSCAPTPPLPNRYRRSSLHSPPFWTSNRWIGARVTTRARTRNSSPRTSSLLTASRRPPGRLPRSIVPVTSSSRARNDAAQGIRRRQLYALGAAAAAAVLAILLLTPRVSEPESRIVLQEPVRADHNDGLELGAALDEGWAPPRKVAPAPPAQPVAAAETPALDLAGVASLCTELARVVDTRSLPLMLERAAGVLDASGIVLWISDPDATELSPIITHGYSSQIVSRLGTLRRDAENATAAAFRTSLVQTVKTDAVSNGAIAAPLVTPAGCVGVMAAEVLHGGEKDAAKLAAAAIVAAQLATLVGPPSSRAHAKVEAAGA